MLIFKMLGLLFGLLVTTLASAEPTQVQLTQTACQIVETEGKDYAFVSHNMDDCVQINKQTGQQRLLASKTLKLKSGSYVFRVYNRNVPYTLGFWLRGKGLGRLTLPSVSGGGIETASFQDYAIDLKAGEYVYSCPLNPTPDYHLTVYDAEDSQ